MTTPAPSWMDDPKRRLRFRLARLPKMDELTDEALPKFVICRNEHSQFRVVTDSNEVVFRAKGKTADQIDQTVAYLMTRIPKKEETMPNLSTAQLDALASIRDASGPGFISDSRPLKVLIERRAITGSPVEGYTLTDEGRRLLRAHNLPDAPIITFQAFAPTTAPPRHGELARTERGPGGEDPLKTTSLPAALEEFADAIQIVTKAIDQLRGWLADNDPAFSRLLEVEAERLKLIDQLSGRKSE